MLTFREMTAADMPQVFAVRISTPENVMTLERLAEMGVTHSSLAESLKGPAKGWVCEIADRIVGFSMGDREKGEVTVLALLPEFENRGIGRKLLQRAGDWLFAAGHKEIYLITTPNPDFRAYGFYQALGWRPTGELIEGDEKFVLQRN